MSHGLRKTVDEEIALLKPLGWREVAGNAGHRRIDHPEFGAKVMPFSPSDQRWVQAHRTQVARRMGITRPELEIQMGVRFSKSSKPKQRRKRNHNGVNAHKLKLAGAGQVIPESEPKREPEPDDPAEKSVAAVNDAWERKRVRSTGLDLPARRPAHVSAPDSDPDPDPSYPCRNPQCDQRIQPTGKPGRPRVFCSDECAAEANRSSRTLEITLRAKTLRHLGDDPEATVRALIDIYVKGRTNR